MPEHTPVPTPARSLYGFFMFLFSKLILGIYCLWAFAPDTVLHYLNIYYYPQKFWSTAIPIQCLLALSFFAFFIYPSSNLILTANIDDLNTVQDDYSNYETHKNDNNLSVSSACICRDISKCKYNCYEKPFDYENTIPPLRDLNISFVSKTLYYNK